MPHLEHAKPCSAFRLSERLTSTQGFPRPSRVVTCGGAADVGQPAVGSPCPDSAAPVRQLHILCHRPLSPLRWACPNVKPLFALLTLHPSKASRQSYMISYRASKGIISPTLGCTDHPQIRIGWAMVVVLCFVPFTRFCCLQVICSYLQGASQETQMAFPFQNWSA